MKPRPHTFPLPCAHIHIRRSKHTSAAHAHPNHSINTHHHNTVTRVRADLRNLLRNTAQPVAVVTSLMPVWDPAHASSPSTSSSTSEDDGSSGDNEHMHAKFHGATLSSFSSIAMDPHPLIAFSLRIPSRMATTLKHAAHPPPSPSSLPSSSSSSHIHSHSHPLSNNSTSNPLQSLPTHLVINILSSSPSQSHLATLFSRPDLHPHPFASVPYRLTQEGLPVLDGVLGALSCRLVAASWPLHDLESLRTGGGKGVEGKQWEGEGVASELFIGQVVRVEDVTGGRREEGKEEPRTPLLYYQRRYTTVQDLPHDPSRRS
ncbi:flavin reductase like domain-containing protein [Irpex lacteus]|nr:flavin reductase like domain-containing protein [Irpex lacteus]